MIEILVGALVTFTEPGTGSGLCGRVVSLGEGAGGVRMVWAVQQGGSRALRAPLADVRAGCDGVAGAVPVAARPLTPPSLPPSLPLPPASGPGR